MDIARRAKASIVIGVVAAVIIAAGAGFAVWHDQPSFCNAICHTPMDPLLSLLVVLHYEHFHGPIRRFTDIVRYVNGAGYGLPSWGARRCLEFGCTILLA